MPTGDTGIEKRLLRSMRQADAVATGKKGAARSYSLPLTARDATASPVPSCSSNDIRGIRERLKLSQQVFADALNVSLGTVRSWEQGTRVPEGPSVRLLELAQKYPAAVLSAILLRPGGRSDDSAYRTAVPKRRVSEGSKRKR